MDQLALDRLLARCTLRVDVDDAPRGTAFFVAPGLALTAAHILNGAQNASVRLTGDQGLWKGHVADVRPPWATGNSAKTGRVYPPPDLALIRVVEGPGHACVLLGRSRPPIGARIMARGYSRALGETELTEETESFTVTGELNSPGPMGSLLKLGLGQAVPGMSGAPVLDLHLGEVAGLLRTSRDTGSNLGAWVVPAALIRRLWPAEAAAGDDFHLADASWRRAQTALAASASDTGPSGAPTPGGSVAIGSIKAGSPVSVFTGGSFGDVNIAALPVRRKKNS